MTLESTGGKPTLREMRNFRLAVDKVRYTPGNETELLTIAQGSEGEGKKTYSHLNPLEDENKLKQSLDTLIKEIVPGVMDHKQMERDFDNGLDLFDKGKYLKTPSFEWKTIHENVVFGIRVVRDREVEHSRSWYLRNTSKKPGILSFLKR